MASIGDIMSRQVFSIRPDESGAEALRHLLMLGVHAAPVLDPTTAAPLGIVAISDLTGDLQGVAVADRMTRTVLTLPVDAPVSAAAERIAGTGVHHFPVVNGAGAVVGFVSTVDLLRAQLGAGRAAPFEPSAAVTWTADRVLGAGTVAEAPEGPGVLVLFAPGGYGSETVVWAETASDVRGRLTELLHHPPDRVVMHTAGGPLSWRAAAISDPAIRRRTFGAVLAHPPS